MEVAIGAISRVCELVTIILLIGALIGLATCYVLSVLSYLVEEDIKKNTWTKFDHRTIMAQKVAESFKTSIKFKEQDKKLVRDAEVAVRASKSNDNENYYNKIMKDNDEHRFNLSKSVEELSSKMEKDMAAVRTNTDEWERVIMTFVEEQNDHRRKDKDEFERNLSNLEEYMDLEIDECDQKLWMLEERCNKLEEQNEEIMNNVRQTMLYFMKENKKEYEIKEEEELKEKCKRLEEEMLEKLRNDQVLVEALEAERNHLLYLLDNHVTNTALLTRSLMSDDPSIVENVRR